MIKLFLLTISLLLLQSCTDNNGQNSSSSLGSTVTFTGTSINNVTTSVPVNSTQIVNSGLNVVSGQSFKVNVISSALYEQPKKYRVITRMDPRVNGPVVFWAPYNYATGTYSPGWTAAIEYQNSLTDFLSPNTAFQQYYNYTLPVAQTPIPKVRVGDAIAMRIIEPTEFYNNSLQPSASDTPLSTSDSGRFLAILNATGGIDNRIIDTTDLATLCSYITCTNNFPSVKNVYLGYANLRALADHTTLPTCPSTGFEGSLCQRNKGAGLTLSVAGGSVLKAGTSEFVNLVTLGSSQYVYQILATESGNLSFGYDTNMAGTFLASTDPLTVTEYQNIGYLEALTSQGTSGFQNSKSFATTLNTQTINRFIAGRYLLELEIGSSSGAYMQQKIQSITYGYVIIQGGAILASGQITGGNLEINAPATGQVYFQIISNNYPEIAGDIIFSAQSYTGSILVSSFLNSYIIGPLKSQILLTAATLFNLISANPKFILFAQLMLTFYIFIYGIMFSLGAVEVTVKDMTHRILKVLIIVQLFSQNAWAFFQQYLFGFFLNGIDQMMNWVTGDTSTVGNIFGFIDPILTAYFSAQLWFIILIYFCYFFLGYALPAFFLTLGVFYLGSVVTRFFPKESFPLGIVQQSTT